MVYSARRAIAWFLAAAAVLVFQSSADGSEFPPGTPHSHFRFAESCPGCHLSGRDGRPDPTRFSPEADTLCLGCHRLESLGRSHPLDVRPADRYGKANLPADLRLAEDGRMLCLTCHTAHGAHLSAVRTFPDQTPEERASPDGPRFRTFFLRRSDPKRGVAPLCESCHRMPR